MVLSSTAPSFDLGVILTARLLAAGAQNGRMGSRTHAAAAMAHGPPG